MEIKKEFDVLINMIQRCTTVHTCNYSTYKDKVHSYRMELYDPAMKIRKQLHNPRVVECVFEYDVYDCPTKLKGQLKIGDFCG